MLLILIAQFKYQYSEKPYFKHQTKVIVHTLISLFLLYLLLPDKHGINQAKFFGRFHLLADPVFFNRIFANKNNKCSRLIHPNLNANAALDPVVKPAVNKLAKASFINLLNTAPLSHQHDDTNAPRL